MSKRVNTHISDRANAWLDKRSEEVALSKSALINIAIENYIKETEITYNLPFVVAQLEKHGYNLDKMQ